MRALVVPICRAVRIRMERHFSDHICAWLVGNEGILSISFFPTYPSLSHCGWREDACCQAISASLPPLEEDLPCCACGVVTGSERDIDFVRDI